MFNLARNIFWDHEATRVRALALLMLSQLVGCARLDWPTDAYREASFEPHRTLMIAGQAMPEFIAERTAVLISGDSIEPEDAPNSVNRVRYRVPSDQPFLNMDQSLAVAIDSRGYFLTAHHCIDDKPKLVVAYRCRGNVQLATPRVVARLPDLDVTILAVDAPLSATFEWAPLESLKPGETLLLGGTGDVHFTGDKLTVRRQCLAGVLGEISPASGGLAVKHTAPTRPGDSGGPSLNVEGRLVGINSRTTFRSFAKPVNIAFRPDPTIVSRLIEADFASRRPKFQ